MAFQGNQYVSNLQARQNQAINDIVAFAVFELKKTFITSVKACGTAVDGELRAMAHAFDTRNDRGEFQKIHQRVGELAQDSVLRSYDQLVTAQEGPASRTHYRAGQDRLPRTLRKALARKDLFEATPDGLRWLNETMLNAEARHWKRINFGAGGLGQGSFTHFNATFNGLVLASFGYDEPARPAFKMPRGFWIGPGGERVAAGQNPAGSDLFYPPSRRPAGVRGLNGQGAGRRQQGRRTRGIRGKNFLDAGLARIATELPRAYEQHFERIAHKYSTGQRRISVPIIIKGELPFRTIRSR